MSYLQKNQNKTKTNNINTKCLKLIPNSKRMKYL